MVSAALGVASGFGLYALATASLVLALVTMVGFGPIRVHMRRGNVRPLRIEYRIGHGTLTPLFESLNAIGAQVNRISIVEDGGTRQLTCDISGVGPEAMGDIIAALRSRAEVVSAESSAR